MPGLKRPSISKAQDLKIRSDRPGRQLGGSYLRSDVRFHPVLNTVLLYYSQDSLFSAAFRPFAYLPEIFSETVNRQIFREEKCQNKIQESSHRASAVLSILLGVGIVPTIQALFRPF